MDDNFPIPIFSEKDLTVYENFINSTDFKKHRNETFSSLLKSSINKNIKIHMAVGNQLTARQGKLLKVFDDYLVLCRNHEKTAIKLTEIKFISIV